MPHTLNCMPILVNLLDLHSSQSKQECLVIIKNTSVLKQTSLVLCSIVLQCFLKLQRKAFKAYLLELYFIFGFIHLGKKLNEVIFGEPFSFFVILFNLPFLIFLLFHFVIFIF